MLQYLLSVLLHYATSMAVPAPCAEVVSQLEAEVLGLMEIVREQHRYIQELHHSQASQLQSIPNSFLGTGNLYRDCSEIFSDGNVASGLYVIRPDGAPSALTVYCDMRDGGGWTVFQRRTDGTESFDKAWVEYKRGFGDLYSTSGEFWLGNDPLHYLTSQGKYELRINMEDFENNQRFAEYKNFKVDGEKDAYQLHLGEYSGNAGNSFGPSDVKFSTFDHPNVISDEDTECIGQSRAGWWFSSLSVQSTPPAVDKRSPDQMARSSVCQHPSLWTVPAPALPALLLLPSPGVAQVI
ncbi:fibrinogen-like protein 1 isoform X3 [Periophthalmus magnuspinnatus]|uniref:fibrinogen-like protein 1 isoform X3 n=1 Tax=Periophthalmus magnuspinnatus TaxID=409849 RepID=UPI00243686AC|nr:fibrinogen-like protein 1 isoform X3 [Periophthalmus magnuspinnatus]